MNVFGMNVDRGPSILHQAVSYARLGKEVARTSGVWFQFAAELRHVDAQVLSLFTMLRSPHFDEQLPLRNHLPGMSNESLQQFVLDRRQVYFSRRAKSRRGVRGLRQCHRRETLLHSPCRR